MPIITRPADPFLQFIYDLLVNVILTNMLVFFIMVILAAYFLDYVVTDVLGSYEEVKELSMRLVGNIEGTKGEIAALFVRWTSFFFIAGLFLAIIRAAARFAFGLSLF